jgi:hypothetical protein
MDMTNILTETREILAASGHKETDVAFVDLHGGSVEWAAFVAVADTEYDCGFGQPYVSQDLMIVFIDGSWLERHEYDGSEWWEYKATPTRRANCPITLNDIIPRDDN